MAHRIVWTCLFAGVILFATRRLREVAQAVGSRRTWLCFVAAGLFLGTNWFTFILAVNTGCVLECSLGYYVNPLVSVLLGFVFLRERFSARQAVAIAIASASVLYLAVSVGRPPWIALILAFSFGLYGLLRKVARYEALPGLLLETAVLLAPAIVYLVHRGSAPWDDPRRAGLTVPLLLGSTGVVTGVPLLAFAFGARRIRLTTLGFTQYLAPTGMFFLGLFAYNEAFTLHHKIAIGGIWVALGVYSFDALAVARASAAVDRTA